MVEATETASGNCGGDSSRMRGIVVESKSAKTQVSRFKVYTSVLFEKVQTYYGFNRQSAGYCERHVLSWCFLEN